MSRNRDLLSQRLHRTTRVGHEYELFYARLNFEADPENTYIAKVKTSSDIDVYYKSKESDELWVHKNGRHPLGNKEHGGLSVDLLDGDSHQDLFIKIEPNDKRYNMNGWRDRNTGVYGIYDTIKTIN